MKKFSLFMLFIVLFISLSQLVLADEDHYWVSFIDKGEWELLDGKELFLAGIENGVTEASLERRRIEGIGEENLITILDLPVETSYLNAVENIGAEIRVTSRWFNCASVEASHEMVDKISNLPFVTEVKPVMPLETTGIWYEEVETFDGNPPPGPGVDMAGLYGPSYLQALQVNIVEAHRQGYTGKDVLMLVIDGGFELSHECFENIDIFAEWDVVNDDGECGHEVGDPKGQASHGTACLSEIGGYRPGNLIGIAYEATFVLAKSEDISSETPIEEDYYVAGMEWAERLGVKTQTGSLGYTDWYNKAMLDGENSIISKAFERSFKLGVVCVTSAGNSGPQPMTLGSPSDNKYGLSIGSIDSTGKIARSSSRGPTADGRIKPDVVARGVKTLLASPYTNHYYSRWNGTSMAAPIIGGCVTVIRGAQPTWSAKRVIKALKSTADKADRPGNVYGWGVPDIMAAIRYPEMRITILDEEKNPVEKSKVKLICIDDQSMEPIFAETGRDGVASFPNLEEGEWQYELLLGEDDKFIDGYYKRNVDIFDGFQTTLTIRKVEPVK